MARRRARGRDVNGILLLDKPNGMTSNAALQKVKRLFNANKAGHTGSLDPIATGVLPICLGEATKVSGYLLDSNKGYIVTIKLGVRTSSADIEGEVIETRPVPEIADSHLSEVLNSFLGDIQQTPPMYSALKVDGKPLYKLARQGIEIERKSRQVTIYSIDLLAKRDDELELAVLCSKGTYIRTLSEDIGEVLGCGAHVTVLRRTIVGGFELENTITLEHLEELAQKEGCEGLDQHLRPVDSALKGWPELVLNDDLAFYLLRGQPVQVPKAPVDGVVALYGGQNQFLGIGHILEDGRVAPKRLVNL
ncbi:tRNA pseudouridine(55) synthase TruB [Pseudomonadota bacterium]